MKKILTLLVAAFLMACGSSATSSAPEAPDSPPAADNVPVAVQDGPPWEGLDNESLYVEEMLCPETTQLVNTFDRWEAVHAPEEVVPGQYVQMMASPGEQIFAEVIFHYDSEENRAYDIGYIKSTGPQGEEISFMFLEWNVIRYIEKHGQDAVQFEDLREISEGEYFCIFW